MHTVHSMLCIKWPKDAVSSIQPEHTVKNTVSHNAMQCALNFTFAMWQVYKNQYQPYIYSTAKMYKLGELLFMRCHLLDQTCRIMKSCDKKHTVQYILQLYETVHYSTPNQIMLIKS